MNPFKFGHVVQGSSFCHRPELQKVLESYVGAAQNCVLQGNRRMGKSSLVVETVGGMRGFRILPIDLMGIKSTDELCKRIALAIISME